MKEEKLSEEEKEELSEKLDLLSKKGVYPYDFMDNIKKFEETNLPPKEKFYSKLNDENITQQDFEHAQKVWKTFNCKNMGDYHNLYLKTDTLLLADVFEEFRNVCLENYELDPAWYFTSPGLAWDAALKITKVKLELLTDIDMLQMIEKGTRGGVSMISNRLGKANNKYKISTQKNLQHSSLILMQTTFMAGQCVNLFLSVNFHGLMKKNLKTGKIFLVTPSPPTPWVAFLKLTSIIHKNFMICTMTFHLLLKESLSTMLKNSFQLSTTKKNT